MLIGKRGGVSQFLFFFPVILHLYDESFRFILLFTLFTSSLTGQNLISVLQEVIDPDFTFNTIQKYINGVIVANAIF